MSHRMFAFSLSALACLALAPFARAQSWRTEKVPDAGIQFDAPDRLERLPMQLGESALYERAKLRPKDNQDFVRAQYYWYCDVYSFAKKELSGDDLGLPADAPEEVKQAVREMMLRGGFKRHKSFEAWLGDEKKVEIVTKGKLEKGKGGKLDYAHWEYVLDNNFGPVGLTYCEAAVYDLGDREVALVIEMPLETKKPAKPKSKWANIIKRMIGSGETCEAAAGDDDVDKKRDKYADTPEKQAALTAAKANIAGLKGWDYFTQPNYIVIYSWDFEKPDERVKAKKDAEYYSSRLEKMRQLYIEYYPLDPTGTKAIMPDPKSIPSLTGPVTGVATEPAKPDAKPGDDEGEPAGEKLGTQPYSVFRLCAAYDQFQKYGQSPPGVVGWFSPASKELVVFLGGDKMMGAGATEAVTYHEGWHQYADFYFHHPETPKHASLHRWFDEGHGDFFGSFRYGTGGWKYLGSAMRYQDCKGMVRSGDYVPFKEIVYWSRQRFYSDKATDYYAQAFSMIDFLRRGQKSKGYQERWGDILDMYRKVMLVKGEPKLAVDTAFRGFTDDDWKALEEAWKAWVDGGQFLNGK